MKKKRYLNEIMTPIKSYIYRNIPILLSASRVQLNWVWVVNNVWYGNNIELASDERLKTVGDWFGVIHPNGFKLTLKMAQKMFEKKSLGSFPDSPWEITKRSIDILLDKNENKRT